MEIVTRAEWGARPPKWRRPISLPSPELWLHHSVSATGFSARIRNIQNYHMDVKGWPDIAYTYLINHTGLIYEGVPAGYRGTHTANHNTTGHAICLLGNFNSIQPTPEALGALVELVRYGHGQGWWPSGLTGGHRDTRGSEAGDCPGDLLYARIPELNSTIGDDMASEAQKTLVWMAFNLFPDEVTGDPNVWISLDENHPDWAQYFNPAVSEGAQNLYRKVKNLPPDYQPGGGAVDTQARDLATTARNLAQEAKAALSRVKSVL